VQKLKSLEANVTHLTIAVKRKEQVVGRVEQPYLRIGMKGRSSQDMRIPKREIAFLDPLEGIALPHEVLVEEITSKDLAFRRIEGKELPIEEERDHKQTANDEDTFCHS
jgi:hypothetical protein